MGNSLAPATRLSAKPVSAAYRTTLVARTAVEGFKKGSAVYLLDDPKGRTWVMISYTTKNDPEMTIDQLDALGDVLKPPQGWKYRTATLSKDLILEPKGGYAALTQDDKGNVYGLTGPGRATSFPSPRRRERRKRSSRFGPNLRIGVRLARLDRRGSGNGENACDGGSQSWRTACLGEREIPVPSSEEIRIRVLACGV